MNSLELIEAFDNELELLRRFCLEHNISYVMIAEIAEPYALMLSDVGEIKDEAALLSLLQDMLNQDDGDILAV